MRWQYGRTVLRLFQIGIILASVTALTCTQNKPPEGLAEAPPGKGPMIKYDLNARPFPDIPFPNDSATRIDDSSPTGRRINVSVIAPTRLESDLREKINRLTGFGIFGSITLSFDAPIDINIIINRHQWNNDFNDDVVFVINLNRKSPNYGKATLLDMGKGNFPLQLEKNNNYFPNDTRSLGSNLFFETYNEDLNGNGVCDDPYIERDTDFDGVFDLPNVFYDGVWRLNPEDPWSEYHDLIDFYERETDTLIMRPVLPLEEESVYAVVITNRLKGLPGSDGKAWPVRSPFKFINHTQQTEALESLRSILPKFGLSIPDVAFAWKFTTGSQTRDLVTIRRGLYGYGPMGYLAENFPAEVAELYHAELVDYATNPYIIKAEDLMNLFTDFLPLIGNPFGDVDIGPLVDSYKYVDYFFAGSFQSPGFLVDRDGIATRDYPAEDDEIFEIDPLTGAAVLGPNTVTFLCSVPKPNYRLEEIRTTSVSGELDSSQIKTRVDYRLGTVDIDSEEGSIDREQVVLAEGVTTVRTYSLIFSSSTTFDVITIEGGSQGSGGIGSNFTTTDGWLTIPTTAWDGTFNTSEKVAIEIEPYHSVIPSSSRTYKVTFTSPTAFTVVSATPQGSGNIDSDFTTTDGWVTIPSGAWSGIFTTGDIFEIETVVMKPPYPTVIEGHGYGLFKFEILGFAGNLGKHGLAMCGMDSVGHGLGIEKMYEDILKSLCINPPPEYELICTIPILEMLRGRAKDLNNDGLGDSGGDFWSADIFHSRDNVRQTSIDQMQLVRIIRSFDGERTWKFDINRNGDQGDDIAGDLNGDGEVDFGGWTNDFYAYGPSNGGILSGILAGIEPAITAAAPVSGGAGLTDIGARSTQGGVVEAMFLRVFGPIVLGRPTEDPGTVKLQFMVPDVNSEGYVDIGPTTRIQEGDKIIVRNLINLEERYALAGSKGRFRIHIPADAVGAIEKRVILGWTPTYVPGKGDACRPDCDVEDPLALGDAIVIEIYNGQHGDIKQVIDTWLQDSEWQGAWFKEGTPLVAPYEGLGEYRNTPNFRKLLGLVQSIFDPADPGTYAVHYHMPADPAKVPNSYYTPLGPIDYSDIEPDIVMGSNVLVIPTVGDTSVPQNTAITQAKVAGMIELFEEDPRYGKPQNQVLIDTGVIEGVEKIQEHRPYTDGPFKDYEILFDVDDLANNRLCNYDNFMLCADSPYQDYICTDDGSIDPDHACGDGYNPPTLDEPLRITVETENGLAGMRIPYMQPRGQHVFDVPKPNRAFDIDTYMINLVGRYFQSNGTIILDDTCLEDNSCIHIPPPPE
ncbi:MAG: hypothetical protein JSU92_05800 [Deltaproteobacteria bacterium]|nr:MAG: hypothetical protein JSU92_05800 [Deltaproteobacteria bacterium]